ncbi:hypothetical protein FPV67DRAFT_1429746, partial [Lyophyllum atratum]
PAEFTRQGVRDAVAKHVAIDNQALMLADKVSFRNVLVSMRPTATKADLPSSHDVRNHIHNSFVERLNQLKKDIEVSQNLYCITDGAYLC